VLHADELAGFSRLRTEFRGELISPKDQRYDTARALWNGVHDRRPLLIAQCTSNEDVIAALRFATSCDLPFAVRGGGHSYPGFSTVDDGLIIDLLPLKQVTVDPDRRRAFAGGGATWGDLNDAAYLLVTTWWGWRWSP
jgi:FAD/FMN-containing dehydrogenase